MYMTCGYQEYDAEKRSAEFGEAAMAPVTIPPGGPTSMGEDGFGQAARMSGKREARYTTLCVTVAAT